MFIVIENIETERSKRENIKKSWTIHKFEITFLGTALFRVKANFRIYLQT